jgi:uncharacterized membrane-anchored protein
VPLPEASATLHLGSKYYFLDARDAKTVLTQGWKNPPDAVGDVIGMIFPAGSDFTTPGGWGAAVVYHDVGYVSDSDAKTTDYNKLLQTMQQGEDAENTQRKQQGYPSIHLVGWAQAPAYDPVHHTVIWARDIKFGGDDEDALNYDVRELGRRGALSLNIVSAMPQIGEIRSATARLGGVAAFDPGSQYADYRSGIDKKAAYGIAGLIAAGAGVAVAQKAGLFAVALLIFKKVWILVAAGFAALATRLRSLFRRKVT